MALKKKKMGKVIVGCGQRRGAASHTSRRIRRGTRGTAKSIDRVGEVARRRASGGGDTRQRPGTGSTGFSGWIRSGRAAASSWRCMRCMRESGYSRAESHAGRERRDGARRGARAAARATLRRLWVSREMAPELPSTRAQLLKRQGRGRSVKVRVRACVCVRAHARASVRREWVLGGAGAERLRQFA